MIFRSNSPVSPQIDILLADVEVNYLSIQQLRLQLNENKHDMLCITMAGIPMGAITEYDNAPVSLSWYQGVSGHEFRGYVTHIEPHFKNSGGFINGSPFQIAHIYCMGASFDMKAKRTRLWDDITLTDMIKALSKEYNFSYSVPVDDYHFPRLTQNGRSDWEFLVDVASAVGYSLTFHGTHLHVFDRYKAIGRQISFHELTVPSSNGAMIVRPGQVLRMDGVFGRVTPYADANNERLTSVDNRGVVTTTNDVPHDSGFGRSLEPRFTDELSYNAISPGYADKIVESRTRNKFPYEADLELTGTAGIKPGGVVDLKQFNSKFDGLWYVSEAVHTLTLDKYFTDVHVLKDSTNEDPFRIPPVESAREAPQSVFFSGSWRAQTQMEEIYG